MEYVAELPTEGQKLRPASFGSAAPASNKNLKEKVTGEKGRAPGDPESPGG